MIKRVSKVVIDVAKQERALDFWTTTMGFTLAQDSPYGEERWLEVRPPDRAVNLVLRRTAVDDESRRRVPEALPTSNIFLSCNDMQETYRSPHRPRSGISIGAVELPFGW